MAIDKLPKPNNSIGQQALRRIEPESDLEYDVDDLPDLEEFSGNEQDNQTGENIQPPRRFAIDGPTRTIRQQDNSYHQAMANDLTNMFRHSFYDASTDAGAVPQPDNVIRRLVTAEGERGYLIRFNGRTTTIDDGQLGEPWTWPTYGTSPWRLSFAGGRRTNNIRDQHWEARTIPLYEISALASDLAILISRYQ